MRRDQRRPRPQLLAAQPDDPFTDTELTAGDRRADASYPATEQHKEFQNVEVDFDQPDAPESHKPTAEP